MIKKAKDSEILPKIAVLQALTNLYFVRVLEIYEEERSLFLEECIYLQTCLQNNLQLLTFDQKLEKTFKKLVSRGE